jgi:hypothetical protein
MLGRSEYIDLWAEKSIKKSDWRLNSEPFECEASLLPRNQKGSNTAKIYLIKNKLNPEVHLNNTLKLCSYLTENTLDLRYKDPIS